MQMSLNQLLQHSGETQQNLDDMQKKINKFVSARVKTDVAVDAESKR